MRSFTLTLAASVVSAVSLPAQQLPDCLLPTGTVCSAVRRLVDRNADGVYDTVSETFDFYRASTSAAFRDILESPWQPGSYYLLDGDYATGPEPRLYLFRDANNNGVLEDVELTTALDLTVYLGTTDPQADNMATDGVSIFFITNSGSNEGVHRLIDLDADGLFTSPGEATPALVELNAPLDPVNGSNTHPMGNVPLTYAADPTAARFDPREIERIVADPYTSPGSLAPARFIIENENHDGITVLEDKNNDGDFNDNDHVTQSYEIYLFLESNQLTSSANPIYRDLHPDIDPVTLTPLGHFYEASSVYDPVANAYYVMNRDSTAGDRVHAHNRIYRAVDNNADGDINDSGEITEYFNASSLLPAPAPWRCEKFFYQTVYNGMHFVTAHAQDDNGVIFDRMMLLQDLNADNVIDITVGSNEVKTVWELSVRREPLIPHFFPVGTFAAPPAHPPSDVRYTAAACATTAPGIHRLQIGNSVAGDDEPILGNVFALRTSGALPNTVLAMHVGPEWAGGGIAFPGVPDCVFTVDLDFAAVGLMTDAAGVHVQNVAMSLAPYWLGREMAFQTLALDAGANMWGATASNAVITRFSDYAFTTVPDAP